MTESREPQSAAPGTVPAPAEQLRQRWRQGQRPDVWQFLEPLGDLPPAALVAVLAVDQQQRWHAGERVPAEDYLRRCPALAADVERALELVYGEFLLREGRGEAPRLEEYAARFPPYAARLRTQIELHRALGGSAGTAGPSPVPAGTGGLPAVEGYEVLEELGRGGMGVVYKARHLRLDKVVALKVLPARAQDAPERVARFLREMKAIGSLDHPNVVEAHDAGVAAGTVYLVMKLIEGTDLAQLVRQRGPLPVAEVCDLARQAALGLDYLHGRGLVHRDLKPSNLMRTPDGTLKILDLGLARWRTEAASDDDLTGAGQVLGTADYLAPEQVRRAAPVDSRADLYGLGGTLFYLLTGRAPFAHHPGSFAKLEAHCTEAPPDVRGLRPEVPAALAELVSRLLAKKPEDRPQTPGEVRDRLRAAGPAPGENERAEVQALPRTGTSAPPAPADPGGDPGFDLPEVWVEQQSHVRGFIGREAVLSAVAAWIDARAPGGYLLLLGPPGQGKSALMAELARREHARGGCLLHMVKSHRDPRRFVPSLIGQASRLARARFGDAAYRGDLEDLRNALVQALEAVRERTGRAVVVLDALDELAGRDEQRPLEFLPPALPEGVRVVLTCRPDVPLVEALRSRLAGLEERPVPPLSEADFRDLLAARLGAQALRLLEDTVDLTSVFARLGGNPLFLRAAVERIAAEVGQAGREGRAPRVEVGELPASYAAFFRDVYNRLGERAGTRWTSAEGRHKARLLQLLCVAREPLGCAELAGLMAAQGEALPPEDCRDRVDEMSPYLLDTGGGRFQPWHQGLTDYVRQEVLGAAGVRQVEETFCRWLGTEGRTPYGLRHRLGHLLGAGRADEAARLLTDLAFPEAKAEAGLVFDLAADFGRAAGLQGHASGPLLRLVEEALRTDLHFLARHPGALFQCLWNRCWWYDCPEAERHQDPPEGGWAAPGPPWRRPGPKLYGLLEEWRRGKEARSPGFVWLRSLRPPPAPLGAGLRAVYRGPAGPAKVMAFSRDGALIASAGDDRVVRVWEAATGAERACLRGHLGQVDSLAFAPDGRRLATGSADGTARIWDVATGAERVRLRSPGGRGIQGVAFAPDGRLFATGSSDGSVWLWDAVATARECLDRHGGAVLALDFSSDGKRLATGSSDGTVRVWDVATGEQLVCLGDNVTNPSRFLRRVFGLSDDAANVGHGASVTSVAFAPDGRRVVSGSRDRTVRVWDLAGPPALLCLCGHEEWVQSVAFSPTGERIASGSLDQTVRLWDAASGRPAACYQGHDDGVAEVAFSADGRAVLSGSYDGAARLWDAAGGAGLAGPRQHTGSILYLACSADGRRLASASVDGTVRVWDTATGAEVACLRGHEKPVRDAAFAPDGERVVSGSSDGTVRVWDVATGAEVACMRGHTEKVMSVAFAPDGRRVVSGSHDATVRLWDAATGEEVACLRGHIGFVAHVVYSPDGSHLASGSWDHTVRVWDPATATEQARLDGHYAAVTSIAFSGDGRRLVSGSLDRTVRVWDLATGAELGCLWGHDEGVMAVAFSDDGRYVASEGADHALRRWDVSDGRCLEVLDGGGDVSALAAGTGRFPWRAVARGSETVVERKAGDARAWFPTQLAALVTLPGGRGWAGAVRRDLYLIALEGDAGPGG
jgi:WD40 repeat protein/tRNA A-37 threonylcarbamoyl transferase component Bud32